LKDQISRDFHRKSRGNPRFFPEKHRPDFGDPEFGQILAPKSEIIVDLTTICRFGAKHAG
jgi:hypothetical protein